MAGVVSAAAAAAANTAFRKCSLPLMHADRGGQSLTRAIIADKHMGCMKMDARVAY
jgi:hypothetical protein